MAVAHNPMLEVQQTAVPVGSAQRKLSASSKCDLLVCTVCSTVGQIKMRDVSLAATHLSVVLRQNTTNI